MENNSPDNLSTRIIRQATLSDAQQISKLSTYLGYAQLTVSDTQQQLLTLLESDREAVYVAEQEERLIGWIHCFKALRLASSSFYEIGGLVVCPTQRQQGIGRQLVEYAISQHSGSWRVRCNSKRHQSHLFYQALGFSQSKSQHIFEIQSDKSRLI